MHPPACEASHAQAIVTSGAAFGNGTAAAPTAVPTAYTVRGTCRHTEAYAFHGSLDVGRYLSKFYGPADVMRLDVRRALSASPAAPALGLSAKPANPDVDLDFVIETQDVEKALDAVSAREIALLHPECTLIAR